MIADVELDDRGEMVSLMEPLVISEGSRHRGMITDLAFDLTQKAAGFRRSLPPSLLASLADLVRAVNCYYSNLIEGHDTHPVDIERALKTSTARMPASATCSSKPRRISPFSDGSMLVGCEGATPSEAKGYAKSTVVFVSCCPRISSGSKTRVPTSASALYGVSCGSATFG